MSNVAWCWHQSERDIFKNNISTQNAENADEIILEECIAYDNGIDAVAKVRDKYKEDISNLSPVEVEKINKHSSYIDTALKLKLDIKNIKQRKKAFMENKGNFSNNDSCSNSETSFTAKELSFTEHEVKSIFTESDSESNTSST